MTYGGADGFTTLGPDEPENSRRFQDVAVLDLIGFRAWNLKTIRDTTRSDDEDDAGALRSIVYNQLWPSNAIRSRPCGNGVGFHFPRRDCSCGFYAYHSSAQTYQFASDTDARGILVEGVVRAWGRCVVGPLGFRAEWAQIVALVVPAARVFPQLWLIRNELDPSGVGAVEAVTSSIEQRYPNVPIYASVSALLDDHPLTGPLGRDVA